MNQATFFDTNFPKSEQLPRLFTANFKTIVENERRKTIVSINGNLIGDIIDDNSLEQDDYRFHDVFHLSFATLLGWSPCTRVLLKVKRKSVPEIDAFEDGARATITEEAISLMLFSEAKKYNFFNDSFKVRKSLLNQIKELTSTFEVKVKSKNEWERAILTGYDLFRKLQKYNGGNIHFNLLTKSAEFEPLETDAA